MPETSTPNTPDQNTPNNSTLPTTAPSAAPLSPIPATTSLVPTETFKHFIIRSLFSELQDIEPTINFAIPVVSSDIPEVSPRWLFAPSFVSFALEQRNVFQGVAFPLDRSLPLLLLLVIYWGISHRKHVFKPLFSDTEMQQYLMTLPRSMEAGGMEQLCVSLKATPETEGQTVDVKLSLMNMATNETVNYYLRGLSTDSSSYSAFPVPNVATKYLVSLSMRTDNDDEVFHSSEVEVRSSSLLTLIQTDKPMYKPGQTVKFRILTLQHDLRPKIGVIQMVNVNNPSTVRVRQWRNITANQGLVSLDMQLSDEPILGLWAIVATIDGVETSQTFKVEEYVLPKFEVTITLPPYYLKSLKAIEGKICAQYTFGKAVRGTLKISVCINKTIPLPNRNSEPAQCEEIITQIDKCYEFSVKANLTQPDTYLEINATVTENGTDIEMESTRNMPIAQSPLLLKLEDDTNGYFKDRFPYRGRVIVTYPDGSPAPGQKIEVNANMYWNRMRHGYGKNFTSDENGVVKFSLSNLVTENKFVQLEVDSKAYTQDWERYSTLRTPFSHHWLRQVNSSSRMDIHIMAPEGKVRCRSQLDLDVYYTTPEATYYTFYYIVKSRGKTIYSGLHKHHFQLQQNGTALFNINPDMELSELSRPTPTSSPTRTGDNDGELEDEDQMTEEEGIVMSDLNIGKLTLTIPITKALIFKSKIIIYYITEDGETVASTMEFEVEECFENQVTMDFDEDSVYPGSPATLRITADPGSLCSVGVVDKSITLLGGNNFFTPKKIFGRLQSMDKEPNYDYSQEIRAYCEEKSLSGKSSLMSYRKKNVDPIDAFRDLGFQVFSNLRLEVSECFGFIPIKRLGSFLRTGVQGSLPSEKSEEHSQRESEDSSSLRSYFPETWLWELEVIGETGEIALRKDIPHTITEWLGSSICTNPDTGFGLSDITSIKAFQPFFLMLNLPYSAVRGETVPIQISIFNYLSECLVMLLTLEETIREISAIICVCGGDSETLTLYIAPTELGEMDILAHAESLPDNGRCSNTVSEDRVGVSDSLKRQLIVEAEGVEKQYTVSDFICPQGEEVTVIFDLNIEDDDSEFLVEDSQRGFVSVIGDIMGPALNNLDNLVRMPYGCGEQNMASFSPNIFVLQYLYNTNQTTDKIKADALRYMVAGYQRQLNYRHHDGSYSAFGVGESGSTWLSAFVVKCFGQSKPYISIDEEDLHKTIEWFHNNQLESGCFPQIGNVLHKEMKGGLTDGTNVVVLTAFTVIAFLEAGVSSNDSSVEKAMNCLNADQVLTDTYTLALVAYANTLYQPGSKISKAFLSKLLEAAQTDGELMYWSRTEEQKPPQPQNQNYYRAPSIEIEMTSYALLAMINIEDQLDSSLLGQASNVVLWLTRQRNPWGGFSSTQDTVIGLQALAKYATYVYQGDRHLDITVFGTGVYSEFVVTDDNSLLLQSEVIPTIPIQLQFRLNGIGCVLVQANVRYNVDKLQIVKPAFDIELHVYRSMSRRNDCARRTLNICTKYLGEDGKSNMAIVDVKIVTGWIPVKSTIKELLDDVSVGITRFEIEKDYVHFYFNELDGVRRCFYFDVEQNLKVPDVKPAKVTVYDYYETDLTVTHLYEIATTCGTKEELPFITEEEYKMGLFSDEIVQMRQPSQALDQQVPILDNNVWYLHMIDKFSRFSAGCIVRTKQASVIVGKFITCWIAVHGAPKKLYSDNGGEFNNAEFRDTAENFNIEVKTTTAFSSWSNGLLERHNYTLTEIFLKVKADSNLDWDTALAGC
ncbi:hypothetical protein ScPMuIL_018288 [Solemya velum]